jgi:uncharacterized protein (TIGR02270 family)
MPEPKPQVIPEILQHYLEELGALWGLRQNALRSPDYTVDDLVELEERIEAHVDGLLCSGEHAVPLLEEALAGDEPEAAFAAAYALLRMTNGTAARRVVEAFLEAEGGALDGIREALCHGAIDSIEGRLREACDSAPAPVAVAAAEVLAFHQKLKSDPKRMAELFEHEDPQVRRRAWRVAALMS